MSWLSKILPAIRSRSEKKKNIPEGIWIKCDDCGAFLFKNELERNLEVCPKCSFHMRMGARKRLDCFLDPEFREEIAANLEPIDKLKFKDTKKYKDRLQQAQKDTKEKDALVAMRGRLFGMPIVACAFEFAFIGGSMGFVVGEKFKQSVDMAIKCKAPLVCFATSGGARMQESLISLMQMGKTATALSMLAKAGLPYISVLVNPCTGGVSASLAMLGDINVAEPKALIGFAGPKVIEQTVREVLPEGFQRSEFLVEKGFIDLIVDRRKMRDKIGGLLSKMMHSK